MLINERESETKGTLLSFFDQSLHTSNDKSLVDGQKVTHKLTNTRHKQTNFPDVRIQLNLPSSYGKIFWELEENPALISCYKSICIDKNLNQFETFTLLLKDKPYYHLNFTSKILPKPIDFSTKKC